MSTPTRDDVNSDALAAMTALKDAANIKFYAEADIVIAEVAAQGKFEVKLPVLKPASMLDIATYYRDLGYYVSYGNCSAWGGIEGDWGQLPYTYPYGTWYPRFHVCNCREVCNVRISWR